MRSGTWVAIGAWSVLCSLSCAKLREPQAGTNTNWLLRCSADDECGEDIACVCGACTRACESDRECRDFGEQASCALLERSGCDTNSPNVCVIECERDADCDAIAPASCTLGRCERMASARAVDAGVAPPFSVDAGQAPPAAGDAAVTPLSSGPCARLSESACGASQDCVPLIGQHLGGNEDVAEGYAGCGTEDMCNGSIQCARSPDGVVFLFPGGAACIPAGWSGIPIYQCEPIQNPGGTPPDFRLEIDSMDVEIGPRMRACEQDADCVLVGTSCGVGCCGQAAIASERLGAFEQTFSRLCSDRQEIDGATTFCNCQRLELVPSCVQGLCRAFAPDPPGG